MHTGTETPLNHLPVSLALYQVDNLSVKGDLGRCWGIRDVLVKRAV